MPNAPGGEVAVGRRGSGEVVSVLERKSGGRARQECRSCLPTSRKENHQPRGKIKKKEKTESHPRVTKSAENEKRAAAGCSY